MLPVNRPVPAAITEQQQSAGGKSTTSYYPSPQKAISSSSRRTPQTTSQNSKHRTATLPPEGQGGSARLDESEKARPYDRSQAAIQDRLLEQQGEQSSERVHQKPSRRSTAPLDPPSSTPAGSQPFDLSELQQVQIHNQASGYLGGAGQSSTNLLSIPDDKSSSQRQLPGVAGAFPQLPSLIRS